MRKLCVFNPSHDSVMQYGTRAVTPPQIATKMWRSMGALACLWSDDEQSDTLTEDMIGSTDFTQYDCIEPWGWDATLKRSLLKLGVREDVMPDNDEIERIRCLSNRKNFVSLLGELRRLPNTVGEAKYVENCDELRSFLECDASNFIMKAPWSSSGRGIYKVTNLPLAPPKEGSEVTGYGVQVTENRKPKTHNQKPTTPASKPQNQQCLNCMKKQGGIMVEPYYNKVKDFAMEFEWREGKVNYLGLSLFNNANNAYDGNLIASEERKRELLGAYADLNAIDDIREEIMRLMPGVLKGMNTDTPFGVDMMIVDDGGELKIHPCVEVNLRRTMGYVALKVYERINEIRRPDYELKNIIYEGESNNEKDFIGYFVVDARNGKCTIREQGMEPRQW